jgi:hypothetical protein
MIMTSRRTGSTTNDHSLSMIDCGEKAFCIRSCGAASRRKSGLARWDKSGEANVIHLCIHSAYQGDMGRSGWGPTDKSLVEDIERCRYASETADDYRRRMLVNALAAVVLITLIITGEWLMNALVKVT